jgi:hypothetical protein
MFPSRVMSIPEFQRYSLLAGPRMIAAARKGLVRSSPFLMTAIFDSIQSTKGVAPSTRGMNMPAIASGRYRRSWKIGRPYMSGPKEVSMRMHARSEYAGVIEFGRRVGAKMPPSSAIDRWLRAKGMAVGMSPSARRRFIFYIRRAISRRGLQPGRRVLYNDNTQARMTLAVYVSLVNELNAAMIRGGFS